MAYKECLQVLVVVAVSLIALYLFQTFSKGKSINLLNMIQPKKEDFTLPCGCENECSCNMVESPIQSNVVMPSQEAPMETSCFPKQQLQAEDLMPVQDESCVWNVPSPELGDRNFLNATGLIGIDTVSSSLRNANLQLRSEPANPQMKISPWLNSTIAPDLVRKPLEGCG